MIVAMALMLAAPDQARLNQLISEWCAANEADAIARCEQKQGTGLRRFQATSHRLYDPNRLASTCLHQSASEPSLDWTRAARCISNGSGWARDWSLNQKDLGAPVSPSVLANPGWVPVTRR